MHYVPANQSGKQKKNKSRRYKRKPQKGGSHSYEGLLSLIQEYGHHGHDQQTISMGQAGMGQE
jgi:hypothetical protein